MNENPLLLAIRRAREEADKAGYFTVVITFKDWNGDAEPETKWAGEAGTGTA